MVVGVEAAGAAIEVVEVLDDVDVVEVEVGAGSWVFWGVTVLVSKN